MKPRGAARVLCWLRKLRKGPRQQVEHVNSPFPFFDLPSEIRQHVCGYVLPTNSSVSIDPRVNLRSLYICDLSSVQPLGHYPHCKDCFFVERQQVKSGLLFASKATRQEAISFILHENTLSLQLVWTEMRDFGSLEPYLAHLRSVQLHIPWYHEGEWFEVESLHDFTMRAPGVERLEIHASIEAGFIHPLQYSEEFTQNCIQPFSPWNLDEAVVFLKGPRPVFREDMIHILERRCFEEELRCKLPKRPYDRHSYLQRTIEADEPLCCCSAGYRATLLRGHPCLEMSRDQRESRRARVQDLASVYEAVYESERMRLGGRGPRRGRFACF